MAIIGCTRVLGYYSFSHFVIKEPIMIDAAPKTVITAVFMIACWLCPKIIVALSS